MTRVPSELSSNLAAVLRRGDNSPQTPTDIELQLEQASVPGVEVGDLELSDRERADSLAADAPPVAGHHVPPWDRPAPQSEGM